MPAVEDGQCSDQRGTGRKVPQTLSWVLTSAKALSPVHVKAIHFIAYKLHLQSVYVKENTGMTVAKEEKIGDSSRI